MADGQSIRSGLGDEGEGEGLLSGLGVGDGVGSGLGPDAAQHRCVQGPGLNRGALGAGG
jgi:hypothetical protein